MTSTEHNYKDNKMKTSKPIDRLLNILTYRRQHESEGEREFAQTYFKGFKTLTNAEGETLAYIYENHNKKAKTNILWSAHIDTMHNSTPELITQEVFLDTFGTAFVDQASDCLGADDGAGVFLMLEMIDANVEGTYIFHRGEERGGWGSSQIAELHADYIKQFTHAVAFDRRGTTSIITHQRGGRCASDELGTALIKLFGKDFQLDTTGIYTDTAEYAHLVPECLNISIGYQSEHTSAETLDTAHVLRMRDTILAYDWKRQALPVVRKPEPRPLYSFYGAHNRTMSHDLPSYDDLLYTDFKSMLKWVKSAKPDDIASVIYDLVDQIQYMEEAQYYPMDAMNDDLDAPLDRTPYHY
jgi:hypothetical protein